LVDLYLCHDNEKTYQSARDISFNIIQLTFVSRLFALLSTTSSLMINKNLYIYIGRKSKKKSYRTRYAQVQKLIKGKKENQERQNSNFFPCHMYFKYKESLTKI